jgi:hypothetical protein
VQKALIFSMRWRPIRDFRHEFENPLARRHPPKFGALHYLQG